jgi:hypothetical protein
MATVSGTESSLMDSLHLTLHVASSILLKMELHSKCSTTLSLANKQHTGVV